MPMRPSLVPGCFTPHGLRPGWWDEELQVLHVRARVEQRLVRAILVARQRAERLLELLERPTSLEHESTYALRTP